MAKRQFKPVDPHPDFFKLESKILDFWKKEKIFEKSIKQRSSDDLYSFYDGPPFVTGSPHYGTLLSSIAKDLIPRYFAMKGKKIRRVWGWDCHGLPIENLVEEKLGLKNRKDIEKIGLKKFIESCYQYVSTSSPEWQWYVDHIGRWVDFDNSYKTMDQKYMETVIWVFKQIYDKGLIYKGKRTSLFCTRCSTPISNFEIAMDNSYKDMEDPAITMKFKVTSKGKFNNCFILSWTTTPWTLPANRALVVNEKETYVIISINESKYILGKKRLKLVVGKKKYKVLEQFKGKELIGLSFEPLYDFFPKKKADFKVYSYEGMVNMEEGTGVVHSAPGFGDIDTEMGRHFGLSMIESVTDEGKFTSSVKPWAGLYIKGKSGADPLIIADLKKRDLLFKEEKIFHSYPYCYRCTTPLIYKAQNSWFLKVSELKKQLLDTNKKINWVPESSNNRFLKGIENAPDWCISRTRYWATPMPIWECLKCKEKKVVGSISEIEKLSGQKVKDLHRPFIDELTFKCNKCSGEMRRVKEVLDCWMESGSMPYGERHYPFENKKEFEQGFPADFISEYVAQTRAWFYVMHVISNALFKTNCFKNVIVTGVIMGSDGRKMSKSFQNYPDPKKTLERYGGDALRLYLMGSSIMVGENINISEKGIENAYRKILLILWNSYRYFVTFANLVEFDHKKSQSSHILDQWITLRLKEVGLKITDLFDRYQVPPAVKEITSFVNDLSTWYIRRSRSRLSSLDKDALSTLNSALVEFCKISAPVIPFITDEIFQNLTGKDSVHLEDWPKIEKTTKEELALLQKMRLVRQICELGHASRKKEGIKVRQPLKKIKVRGLEKDMDDNLLSLIKDELNIKEVQIVKGKGKLSLELATKLTAELKAEGEARDLVRKVQAARKKAGLRLNDWIKLTLPSWPSSFEKFIKEKTVTRKLIKGDKLKIENIPS